MTRVSSFTPHPNDCMTSASLMHLILMMNVFSWLPKPAPRVNHRRPKSESQIHERMTEKNDPLFFSDSHMTTDSLINDTSGGSCHTLVL